MQVSCCTTRGLLQEHRERRGELGPTRGSLTHAHPGGGRQLLSGCFDSLSWKLAITGFHKRGISALFAYV